MIRKIIGGIGFTLVTLGVMSMGSQKLLLPITMIAAGAALVVVSAEWEGRWTEE